MEKEKRSNFDFLNKIIGREDNLGLNEKNKRNYEIMKSLVFQFEEQLEMREFSYSQLLLRYVYESILFFIYNEIVEEDYYELIEEWKKVTIKNNYNLIGLSEVFWKTRNIKKNEFDDISKFIKKQNKNMHLLNRNVTESIQGEFISDKYIVSQIKGYEEYVEILKLTQKTLIIFLKFLYPKIFNKDIDIKFEESYYYNGELSFKFMKNEKIFLNQINKKCLICKKGKIKKPNSNLYPFGPYLECNNCGSKLSSNLELKNENIIKDCEKTECTGKVKTTVSYDITNQKIYQKKCDKCNKCKKIYNPYED